MVIDFDGREVTSWCSPPTTIHMLQGSEYPAVVISADHAEYLMLQRNLLCTVATLGKRLVVIVGQKKAMGIAIKGKQTAPRWAKLTDG